MQSINQSLYFGKTGFLLLIFLLLSTSKVVYADESARVDILTLTSGFLTEWPCYKNPCDDTTIPAYKMERGDLYVNSGFVPYSSNNIISALALDHRMDVATLNAISGKPVMKLSDWMSSDFDSSFSRSTETYTINNVPWVIVSVKGSSGTTTGGGSTTNTSCKTASNTVTAGNPAVTVSVIHPTASEANQINGRFQIDLDAPRAKKITVAFTISGSATRGKDYAAIKNSVVIPAGTTSAYVDLTPINDKKKELTEKVTLTLKTAATYTLGTTTSASVDIIDND